MEPKYVLIDVLADAEAALRSLAEFCDSDPGVQTAPNDVRALATAADQKFGAAMHLVEQLEATQKFEYLDPTMKGLHCSDALGGWGSEPSARSVMADRIDTMLDAIQRVRWTLNPPKPT